jgi:ATP synthase protein I
MPMPDDDADGDRSPNDPDRADDADGDRSPHDPAPGDDQAHHEATSAEDGRDEAWLAQVGAQEDRLVRARRRRDFGVMFGLGVMGMVGWTIAMPALLGVVAGVWLDARYPGPPPWTLVLLLVGTGIGVIGAWGWLAREQQSIERDHPRPEREERDDA